jgi:hypothetical protein
MRNKLDVYYFNWEQFNDTKRVIKSRKSKDRQYNYQNEKRGKDLTLSRKIPQNPTHKTKVGAIRTLLKVGLNSSAQ